MPDNHTMQERTEILKAMMLLLDELDEDWLKDCINEASRFKTVGFMHVLPFEYGPKCDSMDRMAETARLIIKLKNVRAEEIAANKR